MNVKMHVILCHGPDGTEVIAICARKSVAERTVHRLENGELVAKPDQYEYEIVEKPVYDWDGVGAI